MNPQNQKLQIFFTGVLILLIGIGIGFEWGRNYGARNIASAPSGERKEEKGESRNFVGEFEVVRVIDGDTIEIEGGERVRYIGIDTPETVEPGKAVECFGPEATAKNRELLDGKTVRLEKDLTDRDKYNRLLRYVFVGDNFVNLELVKLGFARLASYPPDVKHQAALSASASQAQKSLLGLWSACPQ